MNLSEFDEAYEDDTSGRDREEQMLGEAILGAPIRALDPQPAVCVPESTPIREAIQLMLGRQIGAVLVEREGRAVGIFTECLGPDDGIAFALNRMILRGYRHIPIVDDSGAPLAVLSLREVVSFIVSLLPARVLNLPPEPRLEAHSTDG